MLEVAGLFAAALFPVAVLFVSVAAWAARKGAL